MKNISRLTSLIALTLSMLPFSVVSADEWIKPGEESVKLGVGAFLTAFSTDIRVNVQDVGGGGVSLEDDLGLTDSQTTGYGFAYWRIAPRHRLGLGYFSFNRNASATAQKDIEIGDGETIQVGSAMQTDFELDIFPVFYSYSFLKRPEQELALNVGLHWGELDFRVDASAWVEDEGGTGRVTASAGLPLPLIGLSYDYWINDRWNLNAAAEYFALNIDSFDGSVYNVKIGTEYWMWNNVGAGLAVNTFGIDIDLDESDWKGSLEYRYWGPQIYLMVRF